MAIVASLGVLSSAVSGERALDVAIEAAAAASAARHGALAITIGNEYSTPEKPSAGLMYPWLQATGDARLELVEPWRETSFAVEKGAHAAATYSWAVEQITNVESGDGEASVRAREGVAVSFTFERLGKYALTLAEAPSGRRLAKTLVCKYVRRDIRSLLTADREAYFDAFKALASTSEREGQATYGASFRTIDSFVRQHLNLAADRECDHMHDGMGFLTNHLALTALFERGLQAVDARVSVPYWDYTQDAAMVTERYGAGNYDERFWVMDDMWSDEWFGAAENKHHTVIAGRFAWSTVPKDPTNEVHNSYGFLRAPWNVNKYPYVTRSHQLCGTSAFNFDGFPDCALHHNLTYGEQYQTWYEWVWAASYAPHGPVHVAIGGTQNCAAQYDALNGTLLRADLETLRTMSYVTLKSGWRAHLVEVPEYCSMDTPQSSCTPSCPKLAEVKKLQNITLLEEMWQVLFQGPHLYKGYTHEQKVTVIETICQTPISPGDQLEASSPVDVSFWPIHPTMERLWAHKQLTGQFRDQEWLNPENSAETRYCQNNGCMGHHADDVIPMAVLLEDENGTYASATRTNRELYAAASPRSGALPYIYDTFEWPHCEALGYKFSHAPTDTAPRAHPAAHAKSSPTSPSSDDDAASGEIDSTGDGGEETQTPGQETEPI